MDARRLLGEYRRLFRALPFPCFARYCLHSCLRARDILRQRSLLPADRAMEGCACRFTVAPGTEVLVPGERFSGARELYSRRVYFEGRPFRLPEDATVVDLGANAGLFSVAAARCAVRGRVIAVEAQSDFLPVIRELARNNACSDRVTVVQALVGAGTGCFALQENRAAASHWWKDAPVRTLGDILRELDVLRIDFLKIDIEGSEFALFEHDAASMSTVRRIAMEVHPRYGSPGDLALRLRQLGFSVAMRDEQLRRVSSIRHPAGYLYATADGYESADA